MANKPSIPKGTRDFLPEQSLRREYIFDTARMAFQLYGYQPIETPAMENLDTLMGKYGEEGDRLIFKVLDSADKPNRTIQKEISPSNISPVYEEYISSIGADIAQRVGTLLQSQDENPSKQVVDNLRIQIEESKPDHIKDDLGVEIHKILLEYLFDSRPTEKANELDESLIQSYAGKPDALKMVTAYLGFSMQSTGLRRLFATAITAFSDRIGMLLSEKALRYDLTVPFARFVVQHQNDLSFPFKRYQIQPVWRADRPQRGRYREFYQCDVDVIGSDSLLNEAELICIISDVFNKLGLGDISIRLNNRKILSGIAESAGLSGYFQEMTVAIDKLDKIGVDGVKEEMLKRGLPEQGVKKVLDHLKRKGDPDTVLRMLQGAMTGVEEALRGIDEMKKVLKALPAEVKSKVEIDLTLARGLNYYTGAIIEVGHPEFPSSICGGGRYDDLTGIFGLSNMSGVGVSFGADRIYDLMEAKGLFPDSLKAASEVLFVNFGSEEAEACLRLAAELRANDFSAEVYPDEAKMKKQMKYADAKGFAYTVMMGSEELKNEQVQVKEMKSGDQFTVMQKDLCNFLIEKTRA